MVVVSQAHPRHADRYCNKYAPSVTCLCNGTVTDYNTLGISMGGFPSYVGGKSTAPAYFRAVRSGYLNGRAGPGGYNQLMPATFLIDARGNIFYTHYNKTKSDHPELTELIDLVLEV